MPPPSLAQHYRHTDLRSQRQSSDELSLCARIAESRTPPGRASAGRVDDIRAISASFAHEISQPLSALQINAQACIRWLSKSPPDLEAALASAERAARDGHRAVEIVNRIRQQVIRADPVNLREEVDAAIAQLEREIHLDSVTVKVNAEEDLPRVRADRVAVQQILTNLMTNAMHAMRQLPPQCRRELRVSLKTLGGQVCLMVMDTGVGIPASCLTRIFDSFFTTKAEGTGIGLTICQSLMEAMGGSISARNGLSRGAIFECRLPTFTQEQDNDRNWGALSPDADTHRVHRGRR